MKRSALAYYIAFCFLVQGDIFASRDRVFRETPLPTHLKSSRKFIRSNRCSQNSRIGVQPYFCSPMTMLTWLESALSLLKECTSLDEGIDPEGNVEFRRLGENPEFHKLIERVHRHYPAVVLTSFHSLCISEAVAAIRPSISKA
jgi:hypothetical protein